MLNANDLHIRTLGPCTVDSPLFSECRQCQQKQCDPCPHGSNYVCEDHRVLYEDRLDILVDSDLPVEQWPAFETAGPRQKIFFNPSTVHAGVVTCGGLCPGLNDVIRGLVMELHYRYGVRRISGFSYGYAGLNPDSEFDIIPLTTALVDDIHETGGSILGTSRGDQEVSVMVDTLDRQGVDMLFTIGGDGTQRGASAIVDEIERRELNIAVIGLPKTIDNDIRYIDRSFGFETAVAEACEAVQGAHTEAHSAFNGIGLVKLMGRESGWIACHAALSTSVANFVMIPEISFALKGDNGFLPSLKDRLRRRRHACIIVSEGAGQDLFDNEGLGRDASGNVKYNDIGLFLKQQMVEYLRGEEMPHTVKYIDPSYIIRSVPATPNDSLYCLRLAQSAVHAAMAGRTDMVVGQWRENFVHVPMPLITSGRKHVLPDGDLWLSVLENTGQPTEMK
jgi:6-phosphofructokinase 1